MLLGLIYSGPGIDRGKYRYLDGPLFRIST